MNNLQTGWDAREDPEKEGGGSVLDRDLCWRLRFLETGGASQQEKTCQASGLWACSVAISSESEHFLLEGGEGSWGSGGVIRPLPRIR